MAKGKSPLPTGLDAVLEQLGPFGKFNIINYALLLFPIYLSGFYGSVYIFEAPDIDYRCKINECENANTSLAWKNFSIPIVKTKFSRCERYTTLSNITAADNSTEGCKADYFTNVTEKCHDYVYFGDSAVRDFDLGCQSWKRTFIGSIHNGGLFVSLPLTGFISDRYGRRVALACASLMNGIFGFLRSFSPNYWMMVTFEFLEAGLGAGAYSTAFVLAMELVGPKGRVFGNTIINAIYVIGQMNFAALSWYFQSWRVVLRIIYLPAVFVFSYLWILNESVRWLLSKGKKEAAFAILRKAAKMNKVDLSDQALAPLSEDRIDMTIKISEDDDPKAYEDKSNFLNAIKSAIIRSRLVKCSFLWITCTFVYYGLSINSVSIPGNKYVNFMLVGFVEIPANFACLAVLDRYGRKKTLITTYVLSAFLCIGLSFIPEGLQWLSLITYLSGKFFITIAYSSVYIYVSEVFPTSVRQSLLAVCSTLGRVGSTVAPQTPLLSNIYKSLPSILFGCMALLAALLVLTLPETINVRLPDTVEEAERLSKGKSEEDA